MLNTLNCQKEAIYLSVFVTLLSQFASSRVVAEEELLERAVRSIDVITVTSTRIKRESRFVAEAISVADIARIENSKMFNMSDALSGIPGVLINSKNGAYDARLMIRGGGLKANYGVREIFLMRDGVPITDPDSFTRLDFIDTQDIERIEITKGPGNIYATGSAAGTIHIITRSVFDSVGDNLSFASGNEGQANFNGRVSGSLGKQAYSMTLSRRQSENDWRQNNQYDTTNFSIKYGVEFDEGETLETEISYADVNVELPGSLNSMLWEDYKHSGKQRDNNSTFKHGGRYSDTWFMNARYVKDLSDTLTFKPRVYYTHWEQFHPVTPYIVENDGVDIFGTDLELAWSHELMGEADLVAGITYRRDSDPDSKRYAYGDVNEVQTGPTTRRIVATLSDDKGVLAESQDTLNVVKGLFVQETLRPTDDLYIDFGMRFDSIAIQQKVDAWSFYNWGMGQYQAYIDSDNNGVADAAIHSEVDEAFELFSARTGVSYALNGKVNIYGAISQGDQVPFSNELEENPQLKASTSTNYEIGFKGRSESWSFDATVFSMTVEDEIISILMDTQETTFQNAGETDKLGFEFVSDIYLGKLSGGEFWGGINYAYSKFEYKSFEESITEYGNGPPRTTTVDRGGNQLPLIPERYYSLHLFYTHHAGIKIRLQADSWDEYYIDNANTGKFAGYDFVTSINASYKFLSQHYVSLNLQNIADKRYAVEVKKDSRGENAYTPGAPRSLLVSYRYTF